MEDAPPATEGDRLIAALELFERGEWPTSPLIERVQALHELTLRKERYHELRTKHPHVRAIDIWRWAQDRKPSLELEWEEYGSGEGLQTSIERDGFTVLLHIKRDYDAAPGGLFTDTCDDEPQLHLCPNHRCEPERRESGTFRYYIPESGETFDGLLQYFRRSMSKHDAWVRARKLIRDDVSHACNPEWESFGVIAEVTKRGVELGHASVWGFEFSEDAWGMNATQVREATDFFEDAGVIEEAIEQAKDKLAELLN